MSTRSGLCSHLDVPEHHRVAALSPENIASSRMSVRDCQATAPAHRTCRCNPKLRPCCPLARVYCCVMCAAVVHVGRMFGSATQFEKLTDKVLCKKPEKSFKVVWDGKVQESLLRWRKNKLGDEQYT